MKTLSTEKQAILAILLTALWLILWQAVLAPPPAKVRPVQGATSPARGRTFVPSVGETPAAPELAGTGMPAEKTAAASEPAKAEATPVAPGETVTVETPLYHAELDTRGAALTSFKLKENRASCASPEGFDLVGGVGSKGRPLDIDLWTEGGKKGSQISTRDLLFEKLGVDIDIPKGGAPQTLVLSADVQGVGRLTKTLTFWPDRYSIGASVRVEPVAESPRVLGIVVPLVLGPPPGVADRYNARYVIAMGGRKPTDLKRESLDRILAGKVDPVKLEIESGVRWEGFDERYFLRALVSHGENPVGFQAGRFEAGKVLVQGIVRPVDTGDYSFWLYLGPKKLDDLERTEKSLAKAVDFGMFGDILPRFFLWMLKGLYRIVGNYGVGIIILTVMVRAAMFPLTLKSMKSMKGMQKIQPEFAALREKYKDAPEKLNQEIMGLYRRHGINPLSGCLPMVFQLPVFLGLYYSLLNAVELRCAPFALWIQDLSQPDRLGALPIPFVSPPGIPVLTLLMGATMYFQQKLTPVAGDPSQAKMLQWMPVIFTFMFLGFPAGLTIYWLFSNLVSIVQQLVINRMVDRRALGG